jgi:localization factor PodJL
MSRTEPGYQDFEAAAADAREPGLPTELWSLLKTISNQIDEADQRHTGLLQDLRDRLAVLSLEAEDARASVPASAAPVYDRIESGLAELAQRIDAMDESVETASPAYAAPAALRSALGSAGLEERMTTGPTAIDPFDVVGDDGDGAPWDASDAEALTRIYEESDAALVRISPRSETSSRDPVVAHETASGSVGQAVMQAYAAEPAGHGAGVLLDDRAWLDQRLSDIAVRIEQSLAEMRPDFSVDSLGVRFDAFEERMGSVLGDVATRTDVESLRLLESQIQELGLHLEQTERQLGRLDGIEEQLQAVIDHLSADFAPGGEAATAIGPDLKSLASATAEEVAQRFASSMGAASDDTRIDELGSLLRSMIHDRRQSDEQTYTMLDTVQQAMIRLLDRIDALEISQVHAHESRISAAAHPVPMMAPPSVAEPDVVHDFGAPEHSESSPTFGNAKPSVGAAQPFVAAAQVQFAEPSPVDKLRQDFIADAQRGKARAAAAADSVAEVAVPAAAAASARAMRGPTRGQTQPSVANPDASAAGGSSRKQRLTALALCLVIAVSGAALFSKRSKTPAPVEPAAVTETMPATAVQAPTESGPAAQGEGGSIDVPAAEAPAPAPSEGAGFEIPADRTDTVPVPAPMPEAAPQAPAGGDVMQNRLEQAPEAQRPAPQGIILQNGARKPTAPEIVHLQSQQDVAALSSRLGDNASRLSPADLMPEEVAKYAVSPIAASAGDLEQFQAQPASLSVAALPGENVDVSVSSGSKTVSQLSLPPATVGPLSLRLAAANGDPSAAFEVGARLAEGKGTSQNFAEAITWYQKSAAQGFAQAQYRLGTLYERGLGVKADVARAQSWYQRAAEQGHIKAMHNLAVLSAGRSTGAPDYITGARWFESAAEYGLSDSQYNLAVLHENGLGVAKDPVQAFKWYALAARAGDGEAARRRDALNAQLTADQRLQAENAVASFAPKRSVPIINDARVAGEDWKKRQAG